MKREHHFPGKGRRLKAQVQQEPETADPGDF